MIHIRKATVADTLAIAPIMLLAMEEIVYHFIGKNDGEEAIDFLAHFIAQKGNQYTYEHIIVAEEDGEIIGQICLYPGADLNKLRQPILHYLADKYNRIIPVEDETQSGEVYIDTLAVSTKVQGRGIGKMLLLYAIDLFAVRQEETLGLLVDKNNPNAKKLYVKIGFKEVNDVSIFGKQLEHLQYKLF